MLPLAAESGAGLILMHMKGTPRTMQHSPRYEDVVGEVKSFLLERIEAAAACGVSAENLIIDPGIGFGKKLEHNLALLNNLLTLAELRRPMLVGISRKSFIGKILGGLEAQDRLEGTIAAAVISLMNGAAVLRVHDLRAVKKAIAVAESILNQGAANLHAEGIRKAHVH
jgi:dihydropteroate synthase